MDYCDGYVFDYNKMFGCDKQIVSLEAGKTYEIKWLDGRVETWRCLDVYCGNSVVLVNDQTGKRYADYTSQMEYAKEI